MSTLRMGVTLLLLVGAMGCATAESERAQSVSDITFSGETPAPLMRHSLREEVSYDAYKMTTLVNEELNMKENDEEAFLRNAAFVLSETVLVQPHFGDREVALRELKGKLDPEDYNYILDKASEQLIYIATKSTLASDQASALVALKNLVAEIRVLHRPELKGVVQRIALANIQISDEAREYAREPMETLISPSHEAQVALQTK